MEESKILNSFGERVQYIRSLTGLSRAGFCTKIGISVHSLCSWELKRSIPSMKSINNFIEAVKLIGVDCDYQWLVNGIGSLPMQEFNLTHDDLQYLELLSNNATFISYVDKEEVFQYVNEKYSEVFNTPPREIIGKKMLDLIGDQGYAVCKPYIKKVLAGEEVAFGYPWKFKEGIYRLLNFRYVPARNSSGKIKGFYSFMADGQIVFDQNNHSIFSITPSFSQILPQISDIPVGKLPYNHSLYCQAFETVAKLLEEYSIHYDLNTITQIAHNVYAYALHTNSTTIKTGYTEGIIKTAVSAGLLSAINR
ncbi:PAS fold protein [Rickettsiales bacterium Ac37b]|nr:PAS fold protein [Rickettsiales bacterium Ac37b]